MNVYIVKSGTLIDFSGWEWVNLKAFDTYEKAKVFYDLVVSQINPDDFDVKDDVEIEELTLE